MSKPLLTPGQAELNVDCASVDVGALREALDAPHCPRRVRLRRLYAAPPHTLDILTASSIAPRLIRLDISESGAKAAQVAMIAERGSCFGSLKALWLGDNYGQRPEHGAHLQRMLMDPAWAGLRFLDLGEFRQEQRILRGLEEGPVGPGLRALRWTDAELSDAAAFTLCDVERYGGLDALVVSGNRFSVAGERMLRRRFGAGYVNDDDSPLAIPWSLRRSLPHARFDYLPGFVSVIAKTDIPASSPLAAYKERGEGAYSGPVSALLTAESPQLQADLREVARDVVEEEVVERVHLLRDYGCSTEIGPDIYAGQRFVHLGTFRYYDRRVLLDRIHEAEAQAEREGGSAPAIARKSEPPVGLSPANAAREIERYFES